MTCKKETECVHGIGCFLKDDWDVARCSAFKRKPQEMTNEQWLHSLNTEQLAKWLSNHVKFVYDCGLREVLPKTMYEEDWEWWLKQPHTNE